MLYFIYCWTFTMSPIVRYDKHATKSPCPGVSRMDMRGEELRGKVSALFWFETFFQTALDDRIK